MVTHPVEVWAFGAPDHRAALRLVSRTDEDFISGLLTDLASDTGRAALLEDTLPRQKDGLAQLFQPVHRAFHLALVEVFCDEPGRPRLDPRRIESAGLVVRRVWTPDRGEVREAWEQGPDGSKQWRPLLAPDRDPDPARRRAPSTGNAEIDRRLALLLPMDDGAEQSTTLFVAPPSVCRAAGKTVLYAVVPTASAETSAPPAAKFDPADPDLAQIIPDYLRAGNHPLSSDLGGRKLTRYDADRLSGRPFMTMLALLTISLGLFRENPSPEALAMRAQLDRLVIGGEKGSVFLDRAARVLVLRQAGEIDMPSSWPNVPEDVAKAVRIAMATCLEERSRSLVWNEGRFEVARARYEARAFVRLRRDDGCPPELRWSPPSEPFRIAPWHANGPLPPVRVTLPDVSRESVKNVKPNVAFVVPKGLAGFLNSNDPKELLKGNGGLGSATLGWICGFNIPIITICAFILLTIILTILHLIFWWLPFVKICIPFPSSLSKRLTED